MDANPDKTCPFMPLAFMTTDTGATLKTLFPKDYKSQTISARQGIVSKRESCDAFLAQKAIRGNLS